MPQLDIAPIAGAIGAEVGGVDMARPLDAEAKAAVYGALLEHQVIFFRDQNVTPAQHVAFAANFGTLQVHPYVPHLDDHPEVLILESREEHRSAANEWHSDVTFSEEPPLGSILLAREMPNRGGDTMWSDMYAAYDALSENMKRYLEGMMAVHSAGKARFEDTADRKDGEKKDIKQARNALKPVLHPVVRTHPDTGRKALFVNRIFTQRLKGVSPRESDAILKYLFDHVATPEFTCRFRWRRNSVAFWDNRCTQHYAIADYGGAHRLMHRVTIDGDKPY